MSSERLLAEPGRGRRASLCGRQRHCDSAEMPSASIGFKKVPGGYQLNVAEGELDAATFEAELPGRPRPPSPMAARPRRKSISSGP